MNPSALIGPGIDLISKLIGIIAKYAAASAETKDQVAAEAVQNLMNMLAAIDGMTSKIAADNAAADAEATKLP